MSNNSCAKIKTKVGIAKFYCNFLLDYRQKYQNIVEIQRRGIRSSVKICILSIRRDFLKKMFGADEKKSYLCNIKT